MIRKDVDELIEFLNEILELDPEAITSLFLRHVECNLELARHSTVQVSQSQRDENSEPDGSYYVGMLGVLNGYAGTYDSGPREGWGPIAAIVDDDGQILRFERTVPA